MKRYTKKIIIVILATSPIWGFFLAREIFLLKLMGPRLMILELDLSEGNEALIISTGALMSSQRHLITRFNNDNLTKTYVGSIGGNESAHYIANLVTSNDGEFIAVKCYVRDRDWTKNIESETVWTHAYDFNSKIAIGVDYGNYSSDPNVWFERDKHIQELLDSHGGQKTSIDMFNNQKSHPKDKVPWREWRQWDQWIRDCKRKGEHRAAFDAAAQPE